jgi:hypothetical protein
MGFLLRKSGFGLLILLGMLMPNVLFLVLLFVGSWCDPVFYGDGAEDGEKRRL